MADTNDKLTVVIDALAKAIAVEPALEAAVAGLVAIARSIIAGGADPTDDEIAAQQANTDALIADYVKDLPSQA